MKLIYSPEGAEPKTYDFKPEKLMNAEAEAIERHTGMSFGEWNEALFKTSMLAIHGLLFVILKREIPTLKWEQVQFSLSEIDLDLDEDELDEMRADLEELRARGETLDDDQLAFLASRPAPVDVPKELAAEPKSDSSTSSDSPTS